MVGLGLIQRSSGGFGAVRILLPWLLDESWFLCPGFCEVGVVKDFALTLLQ